MSSEPLLVTGATGFLGGFLAGEMVRRGRRLILVTGPCSDPKARVHRLLEFLEVEPARFPRVMAADVSKPGLGLDPRDARELREVREVLHCAAITSFSRRKAPLLRAVNVEGTVNVLNMVPGCRHFYHMSTAYAAGRTRGKCLEVPVENDSFNNVYEEAKKAAEDAAASLCEKRGIPLTVLRPSITYGDSSTGRSIRFNALYYPVRVLLFLRDALKRDILQNDGTRASGLGVSLADDGRISLPVSLPCRGAIDLIPVDYLVRAVATVMERGETGIFHVVNSRGTTVKRIVSFVERIYGITGVTVSPDITEDGALQAMVNGYMKVYYPYFCDERTFDRSGLDRLSVAECPTMDEGIFRRCMDFALKVNWGDDIDI